MDIEIDGRPIGLAHPTYFIADIGANHDGSLARAKELIRLAKEAGADAAKFQHFTAETIVSDIGFRRLGTQRSHQADWKRSVFEVYAAASVPQDWTAELHAECERVGITFFSAPYSLQAVEDLDPFVGAFKIGSGDVDWIEELELVASKGKPVLVATGASNLTDVVQAVTTVRRVNPQIVLMQCNTNYTAREENLDNLHLNVLRSYAAMWPDVVLGLSDHTSSLAPVLGAVALGARVVERHFTDDNDREGPDHRFALDPASWRSMVEETRRLERALGSSVKRVADNEAETSILQRRCLRAATDLPTGKRIERDDLVVLRPSPAGAVRPPDIGLVVGRTLACGLLAGEELRWEHLTQPSQPA